MIRKGQELYYSPYRNKFSTNNQESISIEEAKKLVNEHLEAGHQLPMNIAMIRVLEADWNMSLVAEYYADDVL